MYFDCYVLCLSQLSSYISLQNLLYSSTADTFTAWWTGFSDPESNIKNVKIRLLGGGDSCTAGDIANMSAVVGETELSANSSSYEFANLKLQVSFV